MIRKEKLHAKIISVEKSKDVNTSVKVTSISIPNSNNTQSLMSCGGQIEIVLFLKNMSDRIEELQALVGKDFDVLHFRCSIYDLTSNDTSLFLQKVTRRVYLHLHGIRPTLLHLMKMLFLL